MMTPIEHVTPSVVFPENSAERWKNALIPADSSVADAIRNLDRSGLQIALVVSQDYGLLGTLTDGDIRRGLLRGLTMASSIEVYDTATLAPVASTSLGIRLGSLTWAERRDGVWWACFANYNDAGTTPGFDQRWTHVGRFNDDWQLIESWLFPPQVVATWGKSSCSGGSWGPDGLLYVTGHDAAELYVLRIPRSGVTLDYVTTIDVPFEGQSWAWDRSAEPDRIIFGISRQRHEVISARIPPVIEREPVR